MAASSAKDKANSLKDSYVAGLIEGGATAPAPSMPTQGMGEQASMFINLNRGTNTSSNDGDPGVYVKRGGTTKRTMVHDDAAYPLNAGRGQSFTGPLTPQLEYMWNNTFDQTR